jgi:hypothetical protein
MFFTRIKTTLFRLLTKFDGVSSLVKFLNCANALEFARARRDI